MSAVDYPEFEIDRLMWECWVNNYDLDDKEKEEHLYLLGECGFKFSKNKQVSKKPKKSGWKDILWRNICCCAANK